jgi:hypothetical protein
MLRLLLLSRLSLSLGSSGTASLFGMIRSFQKLFSMRQTDLRGTFAERLGCLGECSRLVDFHPPRLTASRSWVANEKASRRVLRCHAFNHFHGNSGLFVLVRSQIVLFFAIGNPLSKYLVSWMHINAAAASTENIVFVRCADAKSAHGVSFGWHSLLVV